jgi:antitoxin HigA-1
MGNDEAVGRPGFRPVHPGLILKRNIGALNMTIEEFADHIDKSRQTVHAIIAGRTAVTADMAARLARAFNTSAQFWMNLQANHDVWEPERARNVTRIRPLSVTVTPANDGWKVSAGVEFTMHETKEEAVRAARAAARLVAKVRASVGSSVSRNSSTGVWVSRRETTRKQVRSTAKR